MDANEGDDDDRSFAEFIRSNSNDEDDKVLMSHVGGGEADSPSPTTEKPRTDNNDDDNNSTHPYPNTDNTNVNITGQAPQTIASSSSSSPPNETEATTIAAASSTTGYNDTPNKKKFTMPEPPRWRFVNEAKKTSGYSSVAAGIEVKGLSAQELAASHTASEWNVTTENIVDVRLAAATMSDKTPKNAKELRKVGRLNISEKEWKAEEVITRSFGGFRKEKTKPIIETRVKVDELETLDGETLEDPLLVPLEASTLTQYLKTQVEQRVAERELHPLPPTEIEITLVEAELPTDNTLDVEKQIIEEPVLKPTEPTIHVSIDEPSVEDTPPEEEEEPPKKKRKKWLFLLLLLPLVILATVIGILLDRKPEEKNNSNKAIDAAIIVDVENNVTDAPSASPTSAPIFSPTSPPFSEVSTTTPSESLPVCPMDTKMLTVKYDDNNDNVMGGEFWKNYTWVVKDACSGEEVMKCQPCLDDRPIPSLFDDTTASTASTAIAATISTAATTTTSTSTPAPITTPSPVVIDSECVGSTDRPRPYRDGERFRFNLIGAGVRCVDDRGLFYHWGQFANVENFNDCAHACVKDTPKKLVRRNGFRGFDYDCQSKLCRCLYDIDTLDDCATFDGTSFDEIEGNFDEMSWGTGEIASAASWNAGYYCGKLVGGGDAVSVYPTYSPSEVDRAKRQMLSKEDDAGNSDGASGCLPADKDYVFEAKSSDGTGACCGFDPNSFVVTYDSIPVVRGEPIATNIFGDGDGSNVNPSNGGRSYFGQRAEPCPSSNPSIKKPTSDEPSSKPSPSSDEPSSKPSSWSDEPSSKPSSWSDEPSSKPSLWSDEPSAKPSSWNDEPSSKPSSWSDEPSSKPPASPSEQSSPNPVTDIPTQSPTNRPSTSTSPSKQPMEDPTDRPSNRPTTRPPSKKPTGRPTRRPMPPTQTPICDETYEDFNICFALDMSGSVCNQKTNWECYDCKPELVCNEGGFEKSVCCANFFDVVEFAKLMVNALESIPSDQAYTVVGFGDDAMLASGIRISTERTLEALDSLTYSGGLTNHADAFTVCRESGSSRMRKDVILLITDGDPTAPPGSPRADAVQAATEAKAEGISIIPVMIVPEVVTQLNPDTVEYLKEISSDGSIFEVSDFSVLGSLQESLLAQVSCQV